jgi:hypothetical protein
VSEIVIRRAQVHQPLLELFGPPPYVESHQCMWNEVDGRCIGGFLWSNYTPRALQMHQAGVGPWVTRRLLRAAFTYCFDELGVEVILAMQPASMAQARSLALRAGFEQLCIIPKLDIYMMSMTRDQCRWVSGYKKVG